VSVDKVFDDFWSEELDFDIKAVRSILRRCRISHDNRRAGITFRTSFHDAWLVEEGVEQRRFAYASTF
jgi:hypothetical protein